MLFEARYLRFIIHHDRRWIIAIKSDLIKDARNSHTRERRVDFNRKAFTGKFIDVGSALKSEPGFTLDFRR